MIPSARVLSAMKSTATSRAASPSIRSICTIASLPASCTRETTSLTPSRLPLSTKTIRQSLSMLRESPVASLTAAMTGFSCKSSTNASCLTHIASRLQ